MKKIIAAILLAIMVFSLCACGAAEPQTVEKIVEKEVTKEPTAEEYAAWAEANGYTKPLPELATSATEQGGGINYGAIPWSEELKAETIKEWLKGGHVIADPKYAQDESGYNYRNMMQLATSYNDVPNCTNLELVLNTEKLTLCGISEAGTSKINEFVANPTVCVSWSRQLNEAEEANGYDYYCSYGLSFYGVVDILAPEDLETAEGQEAALRIFDTYYNTGFTFWAGYSKGFAELTDEAAIREAKLAYISNSLAKGSMVAYEIVPSRVVVTAPLFILLVPQYFNAIKFTTVQDGEDKYAYDLGVRDEFIDKVIAYKAEYLSNEANMTAVEEYYAQGMFPMLDPVCAQMGYPTHIEMVKDLSHAGGMMTQFTFTPAA